MSVTHRPHSQSVTHTVLSTVSTVSMSIIVSMSTVSMPPQRGGTGLWIQSVKSWQTGTKSVKMRKCREVQLETAAVTFALPTLRLSCCHTAGSFSSLASVST